MKDFEEMKDVMLGQLVLMAGRTSKFDEVSAVQQKDGLAICVKGQTFGVICAIAGMIKALQHNNPEMPLDVLLDMVTFATRALNAPDTVEVVDISEGMKQDQIKDLMEKLFSKKDKE